jgi:hypothetical protein
MIRNINPINLNLITICLKIASVKRLALPDEEKVSILAFIEPKGKYEILRSVIPRTIRKNMANNRYILIILFLCIISPQNPLISSLPRGDKWDF